MSESDESLFLDQLVSQKESQTCDFKRSEILSDATKLAILMTSFANSMGGRILIGVCDDGSLEGMKAKKEHEAHIMNIARDRCDPPLIPTFSLISKTGGDVYVVKVLRYKLFPHAVKTGEQRAYYIRVGSTVRGATPTELALLFESLKQETIKKPRLEILLVDQTGKTTKEIYAQPTFVKIETVKVQREITVEAETTNSFHRLIKQMTMTPQIDLRSLMSSPLAEKDPDEDLVPIGIEVSNVGEAPAHEVRVLLQFPRSCYLLEEHEAIGGVITLSRDWGGLYVDDEDRSVARCWIEVLGNDLSMRQFDKIYVRFPEMEQTYGVSATVKQHNFPPLLFKFSVNVKPLTRHEVKHVYEDDDSKES